MVGSYRDSLLGHALFSSEVHIAEAKSLENIGHATNCYKSSITSLQSCCIQLLHLFIVIGNLSENGTC